MSAASIIIVLRQVEGPRWCVVRRGLRDGRGYFHDRIATARPYADAARIAVESAKRTGQLLAIHAHGMQPRRFDHTRDAPRDTSPRGSDFSEPYNREDF
ncbi:hypothetical protein [uncultured Sphingomonas sp.]|uniref:hypothetical protein n=1 Tax=uncultured Sphingomonas sp. TaxID=158754 RepID=UPI0025EA49E9|nr:hypothetical protein [uncultured Sphingomonas sp.]